MYLGLEIRGHRLSEPSRRASRLSYCRGMALFGSWKGVRAVSAATAPSAGLWTMIDVPGSALLDGAHRETNVGLENEVDTPMLRSGFAGRGLEPATAIMALGKTIPWGGWLSPPTSPPWLPGWPRRRPRLSRATSTRSMVGVPACSPCRKPGSCRCRSSYQISGESPIIWEQVVALMHHRCTSHARKGAEFGAANDQRTALSRAAGR